MGDLKFMYVSLGLARMQYMAHLSMVRNGLRSRRPEEQNDLKQSVDLI